MDKVVATALEAVADVPDDASLAVGGFGLSRCAERAGPGAVRARGDRPLRGANNLGVLDVTDDGLVLTETAPGVSADAVPGPTPNRPSRRI